MLSKTLAALAGASLIVGSSAALAQPAPAASAPAVQRVGADTADESELRGRGRWIIYAIALALIVWGAIELLDDSDSP